MGDILRYRIPGRKSISKKGRFKIIDTNKEVEGFIVSNFSSDAIYLFDEQIISEEFHYFGELHIESSKESYLRLASQFISALQSEGINKAVLSRIKIVQKNLDPNLLYDALTNIYPNAFVYLISSKMFGTWVGATPELLLHVEGENASTVALAGTMKINDQRSWDSKNKLEQKYVSDFIQKMLQRNEINEINVGDTEEIVAGPVKHLCTKFNFKLRNRNILKFAKDLHPTPAVSGLPRKKAVELIDRFESHDRSLYTGFIGIIGEKETSLFVNLRCAQLEKVQISLYVGGGFTKDSQAEMEWEETENKAKTIQNIIENL